jgi:hypothetical protein
VQVYCDLGTDCADCGPWTHSVPESWEEAMESTPVATLLSLGVEVYVKRTHTKPQFLMPYANHKQDVDVSGQMHFNGNIELGLTQVCRNLGEHPLSCRDVSDQACNIPMVWQSGPTSTCLDSSCSVVVQVWYSRLSGRCLLAGDGQSGAQTQHSSRRLVVDIGANFGYYSLYAAAHGCR